MDFTFCKQDVEAETVSEMDHCNTLEKNEVKKKYSQHELRGRD